MRRRFLSPKLAVLLLLLLSALIWKFGLATAAGTVGDGTPASCTEDALIAALQGGGAVTFDCGQTDDAPVTIPVTQRIALTADTVIDGGAAKALILNGGDAGTGDRNGVGIFAVGAGVSVEIRNLTILNAGDSAIINQGALTLDSVVIQEARAAQCAAVQSTGTLTVRRGMLTTNTAESIGGNACVLAGTATFENADVRFGRRTGRRHLHRRRQREHHRQLHRLQPFHAPGSRDLRGRDGDSDAAWRGAGEQRRRSRFARRAGWWSLQRGHQRSSVR
ncbi:MAG: hypothetical protein R2856_14710 [Caldilineaceae bacterium]